MAVFVRERIRSDRGSREGIEIPALPDDEKGIREALAFRKGAVSFDIVFDAAGTAFILEIQGTGSGLKGISKGLANDPRVSDEIKQFAKAFNKRKSGYSNPNWFENVAGRKDEQLAFIPEHNRPRSIVNGKFDELFAFGKVLIKPLNDSRGNGIKIFDKLHAAEARKYAAHIRWVYGDFMAQSFIESRGAELAPEGLHRHAASLRLIVPFEVINGKPVIAIRGVGYQRVAPEAMPDTEEDHVHYEEAGVVNYHRNAHSVPMSEAEHQAALPVVMDVLENLLTKSDLSEAYRKEFEERLQSAVYKVWHAVRDPLPSRFYIHAEISGSLQEMRDTIRFLRFTEREISFLDAETKEKLDRRDTLVTISHSSGTRGVIRIRVPRILGNIDAAIDFTTWDTPGVLAAILTDVANGRKPRK